MLSKKDLKNISMAAPAKAEQTKLKKVWPDVHWALTAIMNRVKNPIAKMTIAMVLSLATALLGEPAAAPADAE